MKKLLVLLIFIILSGSAIIYLKPFSTSENFTEPTIVTETQEKDDIPEPVEFEIESFVQNLQVPWDIEFTSPERLLVTEREGAIRVVENGQLRDKPLHTFLEVSSSSEEGLMGMTLDSNYAQNKNVYVCLAYPKEEKLVNKVVKFQDGEDSISDLAILIDNLPSSKFHAGCRLAFGPDDKLYISVGDAQDKKEAQNINSLAGKILRLNPDGSIPEDNPFANSPIWSLGHRNPQGFDWHPESQILFSTEHGPSGNDGPGGGDEVNIIEKGGNYGWPEVSHDQSSPEFISPKLVFTPAIAPASGTFYRGDLFPQFKNNFLFGMLRGEGIMSVQISSDQPEEILSYQRINGIDAGRIREVTTGPDGLIYFSTSNQDGRGSPSALDDQIYRLVPQN